MFANINNNSTSRLFLQDKPAQHKTGVVLVLVEAMLDLLLVKVAIL